MGEGAWSIGCNKKWLRWERDAYDEWEVCMSKVIRIITIGFIGFVLNACTTPVSWYEIDRSISWRSEERLGSSANDYLVKQFLDSENTVGESFYLYYFTTIPTSSGEKLSRLKKMSIRIRLFCS